uniref:Protein E6 n=1 Tax=Bovine papillomavirus TaxID=10571 RepID=A3QMF0_9PAPI|nr:E6 [Bovine papillomavirus]
MPCFIPSYDFSGLSCLVCRAPLGSYDALKCKTSKFRRVHRDGKPYGMCCPCTELLLRIEREDHPWTLVCPHEFAKVFGRQVGDCIVRCYYCGCPLSDSEKDRHAWASEGYLFVRGKPRGRCYACASDGRRPCLY